MIHTFVTLLVFQTLGEGLAYAFSLPVPGPVIGMVALFGFLLARPGAVAGLAPVSLEFLRHLSLLFVPAGVGIMVYGDLVLAKWFPIAAALLVSTVVALAVSALVLRALKK